MCRTKGLSTAGLARLRVQILDYAERLEATNPKLAKRVKEKIDDIIDFYRIMKRTMTFKELKEILGELDERLDSVADLCEDVRKELKKDE